MYISAENNEKTKFLVNEYIQKNELDENNLLINYKNNGLGAYIYIKDEIKKIISGFIDKTLTYFDNYLNYEITFDNERTYININSDKSNLLIGRSGKNLYAIENILKSYLKKNFNSIPLVSLDIENYKTKLAEKLKNMAIDVAKEVQFTGFDVTLENMNSFERLIIHNALKDFDGVYTESEGIEPNRHIIIKAKQ